MNSYELICCYCDQYADAGVETRCQCDPPGNRRISYAVRGHTATSFRDTLRGQDLWRYQALLPVGREHASRLAIGGTPLLELGDTAGGIRLYAKDETRHPSGSFKDRATEVALAVARSQGHSEVITASTGNAGASLACVAAAQGMRATVVVPQSAARAKLAQILAYGAELVTVDGTYDDAYDYAIEQSVRTGVYCRNTGYNPYVREGKKTCAFEIAEQLGWTAPNWVILACGDGNILSGIDTGFAQLEALGCLDSSPRLVAAQAASSDSILQTYERARSTGRVPRQPIVVHPRTAADSISVGRPRDHVAAVRALLRSDGIAVAVDEPSIRTAREILARRFGMWVEPSAATAYAAFERLRDDGTIHAGQSVVVLLTGTGLKDPAGDVRGEASISAAR